MELCLFLKTSFWFSVIFTIYVNHLPSLPRWLYMFSVISFAMNRCIVLSFKIQSIELHLPLTSLLSVLTLFTSLAVAVLWCELKVIMLFNFIKVSLNWKARVLNSNLLRIVPSVGSRFSEDCCVQWTRKRGKEVSLQNDFWSWCLNWINGDIKSKNFDLIWIIEACWHVDPLPNDLVDVLNNDFSRFEMS